MLRPLLSGFVSRSLARRDYALDVLRGAAIAGMILGNSAPPTQEIYAPLLHAAWHGWTLADTIFPLFLFVVGVSIALAVERPGGGAEISRAAVHWRIIRRTLLLFALNLVLVNFPYYEPDKLCYTGILAHIAVCYFVVALLHLHTSWRAQLAIVPAICLLHWAVLRFFVVPGFGAGVLTEEGNASRFVDEMLLGAHSAVAQGHSDRDGVLVTLSSISTTTIGLWTGLWLRSGRDLSTKIAGMFAAGFAMIVLGNIWDLALPINKPLWTGSYVALMGGISLQVFAAGYWITEHAGYKAWAKPLEVAGVNALLFFVLAGALQRLLVYGRVADGSSALRLRQFVYDQMLAPWIPGKPGALVYSCAFLLLCFAFIALLYRKRIFIRL